MSPQELIRLNESHSDLRVIRNEQLVSGSQIEHAFRDCADVYRMIASCVGGTQNHGELVTPQIGLKRPDTIAYALSTPFVMLRLREYSQDSDTFSVLVRFDSYDAADGMTNLNWVEETFGSARFNAFHGDYPRFVYDPDNSEPFDWAYGHNYSNYASQLIPMIDAAQNSQAWIIASLCAPGLNPQFTDHAMQLFRIRFPHLVP